MPTLTLKRISLPSAVFTVPTVEKLALSVSAKKVSWLKLSTFMLLVNGRWFDASSWSNTPFAFEALFVPPVLSVPFCVPPVCVSFD